MHRLIKSCCTQFCGVDLTAALGADGEVTSWTKFAATLSATRESLGARLEKLRTAYQVKHRHRVLD